MQLRKFIIFIVEKGKRCTVVGPITQRNVSIFQMVGYAARISLQEV